MASNWRPSRRSVLGSVLAATGLAGTGLASKFVAASGDEDSAAPQARDSAADAAAVPTLYLERFSMHTGDRGRGAQRKRGDQTILRGTLTTEAGERYGEVFGSALTMPGPIEPDTPQTPRLEIQNFHLIDGTILGMGTAFAQVEVPNVYTIIGGSGRYAGARGGYTFDNNPSVANTDGRATITFDLVV